MMTSVHNNYMKSKQWVNDSIKSLSETEKVVWAKAIKEHNKKVVEVSKFMKAFFKE